MFSFGDKKCSHLKLESQEIELFAKSNLFHYKAACVFFSTSQKLKKNRESQANRRSSAGPPHQGTLVVSERRIRRGALGRSHRGRGRGGRRGDALQVDLDLDLLGQIPDESVENDLVLFCVLTHLTLITVAPNWAEDGNDLEKGGKKKECIFEASSW